MEPKKDSIGVILFDIYGAIHVFTNVTRLTTTISPEHVSAYVTEDNPACDAEYQLVSVKDIHLFNPNTYPDPDRFLKEIYK